MTIRKTYLMFVAATALTFSANASVAAASELESAAEASISQDVRDTAAQLQIAAAKIYARLPADQRHALQEASNAQQSAWQAIVDNAINPNDFECSPQTPISTWLGGEIANWGFGARLTYSFIFQNNRSIEPAFIEALLVHEPSKTDTFGPYGEATNQIVVDFRDLKKFWDIPSDNIGLAPYRSATVYSSLQRTEQVYYDLFTKAGVDITDPAVISEVQATASTFYNAMQRYPEFRGGAHPAFTFNAVAYNGDENFSPRIIMGDGIIEALFAIGAGQVGPQAILAHEFGHQVQFANNLNSPVVSPESTRESELGADALASYFTAHARGDALNRFRIQTTAEQFYGVGDCSFTSAGHHGTPNQRQRSSLWAADLANAAHPQGHILPSVRFYDVFRGDALPVILAPDAN